MRCFQLYQPHLSNEQITKLNGPHGGWNSDPIFAHYTDINMGSLCGKWSDQLAMDGAQHGLYKYVADIEAETLEQVFEIGNIGPERFITRRARMTSVSIGNVVKDQNTLWFCDQVGWNDITNIIDSFLSNVTKLSNKGETA